MKTAYETAEFEVCEDTAKELPKLEVSSFKVKRLYSICKRVQDIVLSLLAIIILMPVFLITAAAVFIDDPKGSPIFSQLRVGRNGKVFRFYKFRSMVVDAEDRLKDLIQHNEMDGPVFKIKEDPRITRVGRFIRSWI